MGKRIIDRLFWRQAPGRAAVAGGCAVLAIGAILGGCGTLQRGPIPNDEFVEIENPYGSGDNPDQNAKIWVPRSSLERGVPRGRDVLRKGYDAVAGKITGNKSDVVVIDTTAPAVTDNGTRPRLLVAEAGEQVTGNILKSYLGRSSIPRTASRPSPSDQLTEKEALAVLASLANEPSGGPVLFISKPEGIKPGARIKADLYDVRGPSLIRSFFVTVPAPDNDRTPEQSLHLALKGLADATLSSLQWFNWYGRVVSVSGGRVYIDGGAESGLKPGQKVFIYRGGEVIKGLGFAPGTRIATFTLTGLIGQDGSYGVIADAEIIKPGDYVELEK